MIMLRRTVLLLLALGPLGLARADVTLAPLFGDHAVLQRDRVVPVWGRADAGEQVTVTFHHQTCRATAGPDGRWSVVLDPLAADATGADLTVIGKNSLTCRDVVVGEVWLCSGQSNMELEVREAAHAGAEIAASDFPLVRHVKIVNTMAAAPRDTVPTREGWQSASPATTASFSAIGYFFARDLHQNLHVPVGLINSTWGGSQIELWVPPVAYAANPHKETADRRWSGRHAAYPRRLAKAQADWPGKRAAAEAEGPEALRTFLAKHPGPYTMPDWSPSCLYNGMIAPLVPAAIRGVLWYQGEGNAPVASEYAAFFSDLITAWRRDFQQPEMPFYWVNLAAYQDRFDRTGFGWSQLRDAQTATLALPHTGQALALDVGDCANIHPTDKQTVATRLLRLALANDYGQPQETAGPTFAGLQREGDAFRVRLTHATGLNSGDAPPLAFEIAGADRIFRPANAQIDGMTLLVSNPEVPDPVAVRYAWHQCPEVNLRNASGLPAVPFRTDNWPAGK